VCFVSHELFGWSEPSEARDAVYALAQQLSRSGDTVTLLWVPPYSAEYRPDAAQIERLKEHLFQAFMIRLEILTASPHLYPDIHRNDKASLAVYHYLKEHFFHVVYFALEHGLAHFSLLGKETGSFPSRPRIAVFAHTPLQWKCESDRLFVRSRDDLATIHMEKTSVALCDSLIVSSNYMLGWLKAQGWQLPDHVCILPDMRPLEWRSIAGSGRDEREQRPVEEIVYFGGSEFRSGLPLFCDAVDILARQNLPPLTVTIIGKFGTIDGEHTGGMLLRRGRRWPFTLKLLPRFAEQETTNYLLSRNCLAVVPNLAAGSPSSVAVCLDEGIPFVATDVGGTKELLKPQDEAVYLCLPKANAIAAKIAAMVACPIAAAAPRQSAEAKEEQWKIYHSAIAKPDPARRLVSARPPAGKGGPLVSIIMAHHDRPHYLPQAIESIKQQDYPNLELILVDDGSSRSESLRLLDELEPTFRSRGWRILREKNRFLGAARNTGIRASRGELILFVDDDNALFNSAVSDFVRAMENSKADICTTLAKHLHESHIPPDDRRGYIIYYPLGGPLDLTLIENPYGDANAMIRRDVFDRIGFLNEEFGYSASDWEFFTRAALGRLKICVIPEALYWYRTDGRNMNLGAHYYDNRKPILAALKKHHYAGLEHFYELIISEKMVPHEKVMAKWNLEYSNSNERLLKLAEASPNSDEAYELLAEVAASDGRPDTALMLLGNIQHPEFQRRAAEVLDARSPADEALASLQGDFSTERAVQTSDFRAATIATTSPLSHPVLSYTDTDPDQLYLEAPRGSTSIACLQGLCPAGTISASGWVYLQEETKAAAEFMILLAPAAVDPLRAVLEAASGPGEGSTGWCSVFRFGEPREITARLSLSSVHPLNLLLAVRHGGDSSAERVPGGFATLRIRREHRASGGTRPRAFAPPDRMRARKLGKEQFSYAHLLTPYPSELPLQLFDPMREGLFLRPHPGGSVVTELRSVFPPLARKIVASVEIAHEDAGPFEFAVALTRPDERVNWQRKQPDKALAFSGWTRVEETFELRELSAELPERVRTPLSVHLAIRLPRGSRPSPSNAFFRKLVIAWDH